MFNRLCQILILMATATYASSADLTVRDSGCMASLQTELDSWAAFGDALQIKSTERPTANLTLAFRGCGAIPITVTIGRGPWLPTSAARITPSKATNSTLASIPIRIDRAVFK